MRKTMIAAVVAVAVAGCSAGRQDPADTAAGQQKIVSQSLAYAILPAGVKFEFPFQLKNERIYSKENGELRRGLSLAFDSDNAGDVVNGIGSGLKAAGYKQKGNARTADRGKVESIFVKKGQPDLFVEVSPSGSGDGGSIWISWQILAPAAKSAEVPAERGG